jgi:CRP-like cAMP-binding protein
LADSVPAFNNRILRSLAPDDLAMLRPQLQRVDLPVRSTLFEANAAIENVYFMESGFASEVARTHAGASLEVGIIGREGMVGVPVLLGQRRSPHECYIQIAGDGYVMRADELWSAMTKSWALADVLLAFAYTFLVQVTHSALANGRFTIEQRLARWLLMANDRLDGNDIQLTHEFLSMMLGIRRPGVTAALHTLEGLLAIKSIRGHVLVRDRSLLEKIAGDCYGMPESELTEVGLAPNNTAR